MASYGSKIVFSNMASSATEVNPGQLIFNNGDQDHANGEEIIFVMISTETTGSPYTKE